MVNSFIKRFLVVFLTLIISIILLISFISAQKYSVNVTPEHPFLLANGNYIPAKDLKVGMQLMTDNGKKARITSVKEVIPDKPVLVYNLEAGQYSNFILPGGVVVHNSGKIEPLKFTNLNTQESQLEYLLNNLQPISSDSKINKEAIGIILDIFNNLNSQKGGKLKMIFGGSRVRGTAKPGSDIDIGFEGLTESEVRSFKNKVNKELNKLFKTSNCQYMEHTWIIPGKEMPGIPKIESPQEFFMRCGNRISGEEFTASGYIEVSNDGIVHQKIK